MLKKIGKKFFFLCRATPTPWATQKNYFFSDSCIPVHGILFFLQIHDMEFCFFFKFMYMYINVYVCFLNLSKPKSILCKFVNRLRLLPLIGKVWMLLASVSPRSSHYRLWSHLSLDFNGTIIYDHLLTFCLGSFLSDPRQYQQSLCTWTHLHLQVCMYPLKPFRDSLSEK